MLMPTVGAQKKSNSDGLGSCGKLASCSTTSATNMRSVAGYHCSTAYQLTTDKFVAGSTQTNPALFIRKA